MKKMVFFAVCAVACGARADVEALLTCDGRISVGTTGLALSPMLYMEGWRGTIMPDSKPGRFPDAKSGTIAWSLQRRGDAPAGHGTTRLVAAPDGRAAFRAEFVSDADQKPEGVLLSMDLPAARFGGLGWTADDKKGSFPQSFKSGKINLFSGKVRRVSLDLPGGGAIDFAFEEPTSVFLQDSRKWGDNFTLRIGGGRVPFGKDAVRVLSGTMGASEPMRVAYAQPVRIEEGPDWVRLDYRKDIEAGSAIDFSRMGLQDAPAGRHGWLKNVDGHFEFEKLPGVKQRFYGVNLCFTATVPSHEQTDRLVTRLVRLGYNAIRIHHYEGDLLKGKSGLDFDPVKLDRFDYLIAKAVQSGLYMTTDVFVSRPVAWKDVGLAERGEGLVRGVYKCLTALWDPAFRDWCAFAEKLLTHVNPYTGRSYLDEPALPLVSLVNEGALSVGWLAR